MFKKGYASEDKKVVQEKKSTLKKGWKKQAAKKSVLNKDAKKVAEK